MAAMPPAKGPTALPRATAELRMPIALPTCSRGVPVATMVVVAATVPEAAPWSARSTTSSSGLRARARAATVRPPPIIARSSIDLRP